MRHLAWLVLLAFAARAQEPLAPPDVGFTSSIEGELASWLALQDALLLESLDGADEAQVGRYAKLTQNLSADDPYRSDALLHLGRACALSGDIEGARAALRECIRLGPLRDPCTDDLERIELDASSVRVVPVAWTFDGEHGLLHPWRFTDQGSIRTERVDDDPKLVWSTLVRAQSEDQLRIGFDRATPAPKGIRFTARAQTFDAHLRVVAVDDEMMRFTRPHVVLEVDVEQTIDIPFNELQPVDTLSAPFDPSRIALLIIQDFTSYTSRARGRNSITIDDVEVY